MCVCEFSTGRIDPQLVYLIMSSSTTTPTELYEKEKDRNALLNNTVAEFEAELRGKEDDLKNIKGVARELRDDLYLNSKELGRAREQLRAKDDTIEQLQMALENADQARGPGDDDQVKELQTKVKLLKGQNKDLKKKLAEAAKGDGANVVPLDDEDIRKGTIGWISKFNESQANPTKANTELESCKRELSELQEYNEVLLRQFDIMEDHVRNHKDLREANATQEQANATQEHGSFAKLMKVCYKPQRKPVASTTKPTPNTQGAGMQSSANPSAPPPASQSSSSVKGKGVQQAGTSRNTAPEAQAVKEDPEKLQKADDQGYTLAFKGKGAPAIQGPKQETFEEQAASKNSFAPLVDDGKRTPKSDTQGKKPKEGRKHVSSLAGSNQDAAERGQKAGNASRQSSGPKSSKASQSMQVAVFGQAPVSKVPAPTVTKPRLKLQDKGSASKAVLPTQKQAWKLPTSSYNPAATPFVPASSKSFAQVAVAPPTPKDEPYKSYMLAFVEEEEAQAKSKVPDKKKMMDAVAGKVVEPGKPRQKMEPAPQNAASAPSPDVAPADIKGPNSSFKPKSQLDTDMMEAAKKNLAGYGKARSMEELERGMGKLPKKWSDLSDTEELEQDGREIEDPLSDEDTGEEGAPLLQDDGVSPETPTGVEAPSAFRDDQTAQQVSADTGSVTASADVDLAAPKDTMAADSAPAAGDGDQPTLKETEAAGCPPATDDGVQEAPKDIDVAKDSAAITKGDPEQEPAHSGMTREQKLSYLVSGGTVPTVTQQKVNANPEVADSKSAPADDKSNVEQISPGGEVSSKAAHEPIEQGGTAPSGQGEGTSPADPAKGGTVPSEPTPSEPPPSPLRPHMTVKGKKDFVEEDLGKPSAHRPRKPKGADKQFRTQGQLLEAKTEEGKARQKPAK